MSNENIKELQGHIQRVCRQRLYYLRNTLCPIKEKVQDSPYNNLWSTIFYLLNSVVL